MSLAGLSLRDLEYLVAVAEHRHFGRAARHCGVSQPALSAQVRKLENLLGPVFERAPHGVLLTPRGGALLEVARDLLGRARGLLELARATDGAPLAGPLRIGAIPTLGPYLLPQVLRPLRAALPDTKPVLSEGRSAELLAALRADALDAALICLPQTSALLRVFPLFVEPLLLMHPRGAAAPPWPLRAVDERLLLLAEDHCLHDHALAACGRTRGGDGRPATGLEMLRNMVAAGEGVALVPALAAPSLGTMDGRIAYTDLPGAARSGEARPERHVALVTRRTDPRAPAFAALAAILSRLTPPPAVRLGTEGDAPADAVLS